MEQALNILTFVTDVAAMAAAVATLVDLTLRRGRSEQELNGSTTTEVGAE